MIIQLAMDDAANWNEGDHPRDGTGKFTKGGAVTASLAKSGWKKAGLQTAKTSTYTSANGVDTLNVNNENGKFAGWVGGSYVGGEGKAELPSHLQAGGDGTGGNKSIGSITHLADSPTPTFTEKQSDYIVNSHVGKLILAAGFKKTKSPAGVLEYKHPSGAMVKIHPPAADKKSSSDWTHFEPNAAAGAKGSGVAIGKLLGQAVAKAEAAKPAAAVTASTVKETSLADAGYVATSIAGGASGSLNQYKGPNGSFVDYNTKTGTWAGIINGKASTGEGVSSLNQKLAEAAPAKPESAPAKTPAYVSPSVAEKITKHIYGKNFDLKGALKGDGYGDPTEAGGGVYVFKKGDATVEVNVTGKWLAKTPGHMTKEGEGGAALMQLLSGQPAILKKGDAQPWKNSSETTLVPPSPEQQAAQAAAKAAKAAEEAKANEKSASYHQTMEKLKAAAPMPTSAQEKALGSYTGSAYKAWNDNLRHDPDFNDAKTKAMDDYLHGAVFPEDVTIYRKVSGEYSKILKSILIEGTKFVDHGYVSTSTHEGTWSGDMRWVISVKKGQRGAAVKDYSSHSGENEVILPRGTAFTVTKYDRKAGLVHVEVDQKHIEHKWKDKVSA